MKTLGIVLVLTAILGGSALATTVDVYNGWNLVAAPLVPLDPNPEAVFADIPNGIDGFLTRFDAATGSNVTFDSLDPAAFGNVLLGDGFWLRQYAGGAFSYDGVADGVPDANNNMTDMWISLPGVQGDTSEGGWHLIGQPFEHDTAVDDGSGTGANIQFTDGVQMLCWADACAAGWISDVMTGFSGTTFSNVNVQFDGLGDDDSLRAGHGYWVRTYKDNIAMIIPAN